MKSGLELLRPALTAAKEQAVGKVVHRIVQGDLHDIAKKLVEIMLEGAAFKIIDLGVDVSPDKSVNTVKTHHPQLIGMSALLTTTPSMRTTILRRIFHV